MTARPVILDCDTGSDDAVAIMFAALRPELELLGVTTVFGNLPVANTTDNTRWVLQHVGRRDVGVYAGADGPKAPPRSTASEWLVETLRAASRPVTLVATGPFSNLAAALELDPTIAGGIECVVLMGGAHQVPGVTALAERNVWHDPAAADRVLTAGLDVVLVTLDATTSAPLTAAHADELEALGTAAGRASAGFVRERIEQYAGRSAPGAAPVHDPLTVAWLLDPSILELTAARVRVDLAVGPAHGRTVIEPDPAGPVRVALSADRDRFFDLLRESFA